MLKIVFFLLLLVIINVFVMEGRGFLRIVVRIDFYLFLIVEKLVWFLDDRCLIRLEFMELIMMVFGCVCGIFFVLFR